VDIGQIFIQRAVGVKLADLCFLGSVGPRENFELQGRQGNLEVRI